MSTSDKRQRAYLLGLRAETAATALMRFKGYRILARRFKTPYGEIDLIARRGRVTVFVEVKARASLEDAAFAVTERQQGRIADAAQYWRGQQTFRGPERDYRFDVILLAPRRWPSHIQNAFLTE